MYEKELIKRVLLQFARAVAKCVSFIIKCDSYYKHFSAKLIFRWLVDNIVCRMC